MLFIYIGCLTFGLLFSVISAVLGTHGLDHSSLHHGGIDAGGDGADMPSPLNPLVITSSIAAFGGSGLISKAGMGMSDGMSFLIAILFSLLIGTAIFFGVVKFLYGSQSNSTFSQTDLIGIEAEVVTPIPHNGVGEIVYIINGERHNLSARSVSGSIIKRGETVVIQDICSNAAVVSRKLTLDDIEMIEKDLLRR